MAIHENLKPSDQELPLLLAGKALTGVRSLASRPTGTIAIDNADGTSTIIGDNDSGDSGVAEQVGKTSLPGTPTGLTVASMGLTVSLMWDGTTDGVEHVSGLVAVLEDAAGVQVPMGQLHGAGSLVAPATVPGLAHVTAYTVDNAHADDGTSQPNKSESVTLDIVLSEIVDSQSIDDQIKQVNKTLDDNKQALDQANTDLADAKKSADSALTQAAGALAQASAARTATDSASTAASSASSKADEAQKAADNAASAASSASSKADKAQRSADSASNAASAAASTASDASKTAGEAKTIAGQAQTAAGEAKSAADNAASNAKTALVNANSALAKAKNITFQKTAPSDPAKGDVWYPLDDSGHAIGMRTWDGVNWDDVTLIAGKLIVPGSIGSTLIADGAVTAPKITAGAVTADKLAANSVNADKLAVNSVTADKLGANSVTADKIAAETITGDKIAANSISTSKLTISAGNLFSNPTFAGDGQYGTTDRVDNVTLPDGSTGSTVAMKMDVTGINPSVNDNEWIPCERGDVFYVGVWLSYADDTPSVPQGRTLHLGLDTRGDSPESWPNDGAQGLNIDTSEIPLNGGTGDKWKYFHTYATCPATGVTRFWIDVFSNSEGFHLLVWRPTVIRAADAKLIVNGSVTADKVAAGVVDGQLITGATFRAKADGDIEFQNPDGGTGMVIRRGQILIPNTDYETAPPDLADGQSRIVIGYKGLDLTVKRAGEDWYGIRLGDGGLNISMPDGSYISLSSKTGLTIETKHLGTARIGSSGAQLTDAHGNGISAGPNGFSIQGGNGTKLATGPKRGAVYINGREIRTV